MLTRPQGQGQAQQFGGQAKASCCKANDLSFKVKAKVSQKFCQKFSQGLSVHMNENLPSLVDMYARIVNK